MLNVPRLCLSGASVVRERDWMRLVVPALRHTHDIHLYYNMVSLAWKGLELERRLGAARFLVTLATLTLLSSGLYVVLAAAGAELLEDPRLMSECAIGFSGVLFAMKVLNVHYGNQEQQPTSFFGFVVPMRWAVWLELVVIQVMVPNSSFLGHLAGILAGLVFAKGPVASLLSIQPPPASARPGQSRSSSSLVASLLPANPVTLLLCGLQLAAHLGIIPNLPSLTGCGRRPRLDSSISLDSLKTLATSPLRHQSLVHLAINLVSLYMKGRTLEPRLGGLRYLRTVVTALAATCASHVVLTAVTRHAYPSLVPGPGTCVVGLSATLFCLKVVTLASWRRGGPLDLASLLFEVLEVAMVAERNTRLYHVSGLVAGAVLVCWGWDTGRVSWSGPGHALGGQQPDWTRSWGYAGHQAEEEEGELLEALRRSRTTFEEEQSRSQSYAPSAPPPEPGEYEGVVPELVRVRPPLYAQEPAPPPPGPAYSLDSGAEELRRRRLHRFS